MFNPAKKILFIEDEKELVELMKLRLEAAGYLFSAAFNGEEGLEKVFQEKPDLILLDVLLPKLDGLSVCRKLKTDTRTKDIPIIIISGSGGKDLPQRCQQAGADDFIAKPFEATELLAKLASFLRQKSHKTIEF
jgi:CheY-like chemotaxis protein